MQNKEGFEFRIDPKKISETPKATQSKKISIEQSLMELKEKTPFDSGDLVTTTKGPYAHIGLMVIRKKDNDVFEVAPAPDKPTIEISGSELFHIDDYNEALKYALVEEQVFAPTRSPKNNQQ